MISRLFIYKESYFPATIKLWNSLDLNLRQMPTFPSFKVNLCTLYFQLKRTPVFFVLYGEKYIGVVHNYCNIFTTFRNNMLYELSAYDMRDLPMTC